MSRLIDADKLIEKIDGYTRTNNVEFNIACKYIIEVVKEQPTAFDVDKVVEQLEKSHFHTESTFDDDGCCNDDSEEVVNLNEAIEIVRKCGIDEVDN